MLKAQSSVSLHESNPVSYLHDVLVSYQSIYPRDLKPSAALTDTVDSLRGADKFKDLKEILRNSQPAADVFANLFWLYFTLRFQHGAYSELHREYEREIKDKYVAVFYALHQFTEGNELFQKEIIRARLRRIPMVYAWGVVRKFCDMFKKSIGEFNQKFVVKCCQATYYQLQGLCVTEAFVLNELRILISDHLLYEIFPK